LASLTGLYICYWSLQDPLCQTQSLAYLRELTKCGGQRFALITFEQAKYKTSLKQRERLKSELQQAGIYWYPLKYHKRFPMLATAYDCLCGILMGMWIAFRHRPTVVHSRSSIAAAMGLAIASLCRLKFLYDADARLSEEYADNGHWSRRSRAFRVTAWVEAQARKRAQSIVVLSETLRRDFRQEFRVTAPIEVIPCCVDLQAFAYDARKRERGRRELGVQNEKLFIYVGKTGPRYLVEEMFEFFRIAKQQLGAVRLLVLSAEDPEGFHRIAERQNVRRDNYCVLYASREKVSEYLCAADAGLAFIRSANCERGSSPIKLGEYLAAGLPVVLTDKIGDYSEWIAQNHLGAVLGRLDAESYGQACTGLLEIWAQGSSFQARCRKFAQAKVALESVGAVRYRKVYEGLRNGLSEISSV
jgi:glycosyltransferase involved in cell wall biosynthesis